MGAREDIAALYQDRPATDRELVSEFRDDITTALSREVKLIQLYEVMKKNGFRGSRKTFTRILSEQGIRINDSKKAVAPAAMPTKPQATPPAQGYKIWGGKNSNPAPPSPPAQETKEKSIEEILRERNGSKAFF